MDVAGLYFVFAGERVTAVNVFAFLPMTSTRNDSKHGLIFNSAKLTFTHNLVMGQEDISLAHSATLA